MLTEAKYSFEVKDSFVLYLLVESLDDRQAIYSLFYYNPNIQNV